MDDLKKFEYLPEINKQIFAVFAMDLVNQCFAMEGAEEDYQKWLKERNKKK